MRVIQPRTMEISENELWLLSYYRESELAGALIMGRLARETEDDDLRVHLTSHCAEEAQHAWLWTRTILEVGATPRRVSETYQSRYYAEIGHPATVLEVLALTQVFEKRVLSHFQDHLRSPVTHPAVARTLKRMIAEEAGHIGWVKARLDRHAREKGEDVVAAILRRYAEIDQKVYAGVVEYRDCFSKLVDPARLNGRPYHTTLRPEISRDDVESYIGRIVAGSIGCREEDLNPLLGLHELGVDSLDLVVVVCALEEAFQIELSPEETQDLRTLGDLVGKVRALRQVDGEKVSDSLHKERVS